MAALVGVAAPFAHGGMWGIAVELAAALAIVAVALAVWIGNRNEEKER
ncbi:MAG TPA: hypothetical protein VHH55_07585 [Gaiellaceae bacterium]|nr:hypothetical protein [Gaiellaceae bacterium]